MPRMGRGIALDNSCPIARGQASAAVFDPVATQRCEHAVVAQNTGDVRGSHAVGSEVIGDKPGDGELGDQPGIEDGAAVVAAGTQRSGVGDDVPLFGGRAVMLGMPKAALKLLAADRRLRGTALTRSPWRRSAAGSRGVFDDEPRGPPQTARPAVTSRGRWLPISQRNRCGRGRRQLAPYLRTELSAGPHRPAFRSRKRVLPRHPQWHGPRTLRRSKSLCQRLSPTA
jgi:hypothetical protein